MAKTPGCTCPYPSCVDCDDCLACLDMVKSREHPSGEPTVEEKSEKILQIPTDYSNKDPIIASSCLMWVYVIIFFAVLHAGRVFQWNWVIALEQYLYSSAIASLIILGSLFITNFLVYILAFQLLKRNSIARSKKPPGPIAKFGLGLKVLASKIWWGSGKVIMVIAWLVFWELPMSMLFALPFADAEGKKQCPCGWGEIKWNCRNGVLPNIRIAIGAITAFLAIILSIVGFIANDMPGWLHWTAMGVLVTNFLGVVYFLGDKEYEKRQKQGTS